MVVNPYIEHKLNNGKFLRVFKNDVLTEELVWHRDKHNRVVEVVEGIGWELQFEDKLPQALKQGGIYKIPANTYHRIKRGETDLVVKIEETL